MKSKIKYIIGVAAIVLATVSITGCAAERTALASAIGANPSAPAGLEKTIFTTVTNYVTQINTLTNTVIVTNAVVQTVTNTVGQVVTQTNIVSVPELVVTTITNVVPAYTETPNAMATGTIQATGAVVNTVAPGIGTMVSTGLTALLGLWAYLRSNKNASTISITYAQEIETLREFIQSLPNGVKYDSAITSWLQSHQLESDVATQILQTVENEVSNPDAKAAAAEIITTLNTLGTPVKPAA
jgi:hypothetical protein